MNKVIVAIIIIISFLSYDCNNTDENKDNLIVNFKIDETYITLESFPYKGNTRRYYINGGICYHIEKYQGIINYIGLEIEGLTNVGYSYAIDKEKETPKTNERKKLHFDSRFFKDSSCIVDSTNIMMFVAGYFLQKKDNSYEIIDTIKWEKRFKIYVSNYYEK